MSNNEAISENEESMAVVQVGETFQDNFVNRYTQLRKEMIRDIRESAASSRETNITSLTDEELLIQQALALPMVNESSAVSEEADNDTVDSTSEEFDEAVNTTVRRLTIARNSAELQESFEPEARFSRTISIQQIHNIQHSEILTQEEPESVSAAASSSAAASNIPKKKPHIMISYSRTSSDICQRIRKSLRALKYKVWMDVYDMRGNIVDGMANAIENSYIVLVCLSHRYEQSKWCRREIEDVAERDINFIPCYMEEPFTVAGWLSLLLGRRLWVDFSKNEQYDNAFRQLINEITAIEQQISINPRETPPATPGINVPTTITLNPTVGSSTDLIMRDFKTWIEANQDNLRQLHPQQSCQLIRTLIRASRTDDHVPDDRLIQQLFSSNPQEHSSFLRRLNADFPLVQSLCLIIALWTAGVIFKRT